nr:hypothetical protein [Candidatus Gracilibacteria bacterium]
MGLDDFDSGEAGDESGNTANSGLEVSEKFKESVKKASAKSQKIQKDEKKAKKYDLLLAHFLVKIILEKKYDDIVSLLFPCRDRGYPSNFLIGIFSLIYEDISKAIRDISGKSHIKFEYKNNIEKDFDDNDMPKELRDRINHWVEDMMDVVAMESSDILTKRLIDLLDNYDEDLHKFISEVFVYFFKSLNINISEGKSYNYVDFIISELKKSYRSVYFSVEIEGEE